VLAQIGLYFGFLENASAIVRRSGGDVWLIARGTRVVDFGETLSPGARLAILAHPCVQRVRALVMTWAPIRKRGGANDSVQVIGFEPGEGPMLPWSLREGLPSDLASPLRVAVDVGDVEKLELPARAVGAPLEIRGQLVHVAALTSGIRAFTLQPYVFTVIDTARRLTAMADECATYFIADLRDPTCSASVIAMAKQRRDLDALTTDAFAQATEDYWVNASGVGAALAFSAILAIVVGVVIVSQTLYSLTQDHERELATLKALGASGRELVGFVGWQASVLALAGAVLGTGLAFYVKRVLTASGLTLAMSPTVLLLSYCTVAGMCAVASLTSVRKVIRLEAGEVFK
jgi:putative ABC transport system permease protein